MSGSMAAVQLVHVECSDRTVTVQHHIVRVVDRPGISSLLHESCSEGGIVDLNYLGFYRGVIH